MYPLKNCLLVTLEKISVLRSDQRQCWNSSHTHFGVFNIDHMSSLHFHVTNTKKHRTRFAGHCRSAYADTLFLNVSPLAGCFSLSFLFSVLPSFSRLWYSFLAPIDTFWGELCSVWRPFGLVFFRRILRASSSNFRNVGAFFVLTKIENTNAVWIFEVAPPELTGILNKIRHR